MCWQVENKRENGEWKVNQNGRRRKREKGQEESKWKHCKSKENKIHQGRGSLPHSLVQLSANSGQLRLTGGQVVDGGEVVGAGKKRCSQVVVGSRLGSGVGAGHIVEVDSHDHQTRGTAGQGCQTCWLLCWMRQAKVCSCSVPLRLDLKRAGSTSAVDPGTSPESSMDHTDPMEAAFGHRRAVACRKPGVGRGDCSRQLPR